MMSTTIMNIIVYEAACDTHIPSVVVDIIIGRSKNAGCDGRVANDDGIIGVSLSIESVSISDTTSIVPAADSSSCTARRLRPAAGAAAAALPSLFSVLMKQHPNWKLEDFQMQRTFITELEMP